MHFKNRYVYPRIGIWMHTVKEMETICSLSGRQGAAIVVQQKNPPGTIIALAYYRLNPILPGKPPELAIVVEDRFQGMGVGKALLKHLFQQAAATGIKTILAFTHPQNHRMRHLLYHSAYPFDQSIDNCTLEATIHLRPDAALGRRPLFNPNPLADPYAGLDL
jgi:RimJ/RimL family protein N-acetyltransferase